MKNGVFFTILLLLAVSSFAQDIRNRYLFIEGSASKPDHYEFFRSNFAMEARGAGYIITQSKAEALHTLRFRVGSEVVFDGEEEYDQYVLTVSLHRNDDDSRLITFDFNFFELDEMYMFTRTLVLNATANIPLPILTEDTVFEEGNQWNKWIYFRASFDYPITFYLLQSAGLVGGIGVYNIKPERVAPIDHKIMAMPGATVGVEFQRFNFLSLEANFQMNMGDTRNNYFVNMAAGLELKFPVKFQHIMLVPYGAFVYTINVSPVFSDFPPYAAGGGIQLCGKAGRRGAIFVDAKYVFSFQGDAVMHNPYQLTPEPPVIHYKRSHLGLGIGYKIGILDRPKKATTNKMTFK